MTAPQYVIVHHRSLRGSGYPVEVRKRVTGRVEEKTR